MKYRFTTNQGEEIEIIIWYGGFDRALKKLFKKTNNVIKNGQILTPYGWKELGKNWKKHLPNNMLVKDLRVYKTNAGLGHKETAYLVKTDTEGLYLVVDFAGRPNNDIYVIGEAISFSEPEPSDYDLTKSPLYNSYLFKYFLGGNREQCS